MPRIVHTVRVFDMQALPGSIHLPGAFEETACGFSDVDHECLDPVEFPANCSACLEAVRYYRLMRLPDGSTPLIG